jgi:FixJ family two-component response regulator
MAETATKMPVRNEGKEADRPAEWRPFESLRREVDLYISRIDKLRPAPTISIVDDDESMRCGVKSLVTSLGFDAFTFASAEEFLQSPRLDDTACLITDLQMPGLSGIELQKSLLAQDRQIPIIFMTAFPEERMRTRAMDAGALGFLSKPFESQTLITLIDKAIATSRTN